MSELLRVPTWFDASFDHLANLHTQKKLPHALLLHGMKGIGKFEFAKSFAQSLLCHKPESGKSCGTCKACELNAAGSHPDLFILQPEDLGKQLKVDQIRSLSEVVYSTAQQGGYRVVIIEPADAMNIAAANALLKMLEEPGADTLMLLITAKMGQLLPTIKSRCQHVDCKTPSKEASVAWLQQQAELEPTQLENILMINRGAPMESLNYINVNMADQRAQLIKGLADILKQRRSVYEVAQSWQKFDIELLLGWFYSLLSDVTRLASCNLTAEPRQTDAINMLTAVAKKTDLVKLFKLIDVVQEERKALLSRQNPNKQLLLESVLLEWAALLK